MARTKFLSVHRRILEDLSRNFEAGQRYRTIRTIASEFQVSLQTAQYAVSALREEGYLCSEEKRGLFVLKKPNSIDLRGKRILVTSSMFDPRFTEAFLVAIRSVAEGFEIGVVTALDEEKDANTVQHGDHLIQLYRHNDASGMIALAYRNVELAFYHAMNAGCLIITDVCFPNLPMLPAVQSDNHRHSMEAARTFARLGKKEIIVVGYWKTGNVRHLSFESEFKRLVADGSIKYLFLGDETSPADLYMFFRHFNSRKAVFTTDYAANHTVSTYFMTYGISPKGNFMVYDSETDFFRHPGLDPVEAAAPGLNALGRRLAERLIGRMADQAWSEPLQELL